jgi:hypothetical protein
MNGAKQEEQGFFSRLLGRKPKKPQTPQELLKRFQAQYNLITGKTKGGRGVSPMNVASPKYKNNQLKKYNEMLKTVKASDPKLVKGLKIDLTKTAEQLFKETQKGMSAGLTGEFNIKPEDVKKNRVYMDKNFAPRKQNPTPKNNNPTPKNNQPTFMNIKKGGSVKKSKALYTRKGPCK